MTRQLLTFSVLFRSLSRTGYDEDLGISPTTPLEGNGTRVQRACPTKPILLVRTRGTRAFACGQTLT